MDNSPFDDDSVHSGVYLGNEDMPGDTKTALEKEHLTRQLALVNAPILKKAKKLIDAHRDASGNVKSFTSRVDLKLKDAPQKVMDELRARDLFHDFLDKFESDFIGVLEEALEEHNIEVKAKREAKDL